MQETQFSDQQVFKLRESLAKKLEAFASTRVIVIGDLGLDAYVTGEVRRISPEGPVPIVEVGQEEQRLGLSANVAQNVASLGGQVDLISVVGQDSAADQIRDMLAKAQVSSNHLVVDSSRPTTRKLRVMSGHHHIVRVDFEQKRFLSPEVEKQVLARFAEGLKLAQAVIVEDYAKGVVSQSLVRQVIELSHAQGKKVFVDPHPSTPIENYMGSDLMTPNREEAARLLGLGEDNLHTSSDAILKMGESLLKKLKMDQVVITRGKEGMSLFYPDRVVHLPTYARQVFDVTGAGDTAIAAMSLAWASGFSLEEACVLANFASGVVVGKVGCVPCSKAELLAYMNSHS